MEPSDDGAWLAASQPCVTVWALEGRSYLPRSHEAPHYARCRQRAPGAVGLRQRIVKEQSNIGGAPIQLHISNWASFSQTKNDYESLLFGLVMSVRFD